MAKKKEEPVKRNLKKKPKPIQPTRPQDVRAWSLRAEAVGL